MLLGKFSKTPEEIKRYTINYSEWLDTGETVITKDFEVTPIDGTPLEIDPSAIDFTGTIVSFFASLGNDGDTYKVVVMVTTSGGQTKEDYILFQIKDS